VPVTVSGTLTNGRAFGDAIERFGRRSVAQQLRRQGEFAGAVAVQIAEAELGPPRSGSRHRGGPHYHSGFRVEYTGLEDFASGDMQVSVKNIAKHAGWIEEGTGGHTISPVNASRLRWPFAPYAQDGPPWAFVGSPGQSVEHPGFEGFHICERAAVMAIIQRLAGRTLGHARIRVSSR
jgi:hypothetical protein